MIYERTSRSWENDGKIYLIVEEFDDNGTPDDFVDDTLVQQISKVEIGLTVDRETEDMLKGIPKLMIAEENIDLVSANVTVLKSWFSNQIGIRIDNNGGGVGTYKFVYQYTVPNKYAKDYRARIEAVQPVGSLNCTLSVSVKDSKGNDLDNDSITNEVLTNSITTYNTNATGNENTKIGEKITLIITITLPDSDDRVYTTIPIIGIV